MQVLCCDASHEGLDFSLEGQDEPGPPKIYNLPVNLNISNGTFSLQHKFKWQIGTHINEKYKRICSILCLFLCLFFSPLTKVKLINELNEREANLGVKESVSWHSEYKDSAWIFVGKSGPPLTL